MKDKKEGKKERKDQENPSQLKNLFLFFSLTDCSSHGYEIIIILFRFQRRKSLCSYDSSFVVTGEEAGNLLFFFFVPSHCILYLSLVSFTPSFPFPLVPSLITVFI